MAVRARFACVYRGRIGGVVWADPEECVQQVSLYFGRIFSQINYDCRDTAGRPPTLVPGAGARGTAPSSVISPPVCVVHPPSPTESICLVFKIRLFSGFPNLERISRQQTLICSKQYS